MTNTLAYLLDGKIYINLTNRCTNSCIFCLRNDKDDVCGQEMLLDDENFTSEDVIAQLKPLLDKNIYKDVVFCGYGEPMLKLDILKETAKFVKDNYPDIKIRVNTNGHANYVYKKNVVPELKGLIDEFSISLNAENSQEYDRLSRPKFANAYDEVKKFIKASSGCKIKTTASIVEGYKGEHHDIPLCKKIAAENGAELRVREWIKNGYS